MENYKFKESISALSSQEQTQNLECYQTGNIPLDDPTLNDQGTQTRSKMSSICEPKRETNKMYQSERIMNINKTGGFGHRQNLVAAEQYNERRHSLVTGTN